MSAGVRDLRPVLPDPGFDPTAVPKGGTYIDPHGTVVRRLTGRADGVICTQAYSSSNWQPWSVSMRWVVLVFDGAAMLHAFDRVTGEIALVGPLMRGLADVGPVDAEAVVWSRYPGEEDVCYVAEPGKLRIWRVNCARPEASRFGELRRFNRRSPADASVFEMPQNSLLHQPSCSDDTKVWALNVVDAAAADGRMSAWVWDRRTSLVTRVDDSAWRSPLKQAVVSPDGVTVRCVLKDETVVFVNLADPSRSVTAAPSVPEDRVVEHGDWTREWWAFGRGDNALTLRRPERPLEHAAVRFEPGWGSAWHASCGRNAALVTTYGGDRSWGPWECVVALCRYDGGPVIRLAHTRSLGLGGSLTVPGSYVVAGPVWQSYYGQGRGALSPDEAWAIWASDLGSGASGDVSKYRVDAMLVAVPPGAREEALAAERDAAVADWRAALVAVAATGDELGAATAALSARDIELAARVLDIRAANDRARAAATALGYPPAT